MGQRTGLSASCDETYEIAGATHLPVLVGSGVAEDNIASILSRANAVIVASSLKVGGDWWNAVEPERVTRFLARAGEGLESGPINLFDRQLAT